jgi:hypothetical protein
VSSNKVSISQSCWLTIPQLRSTSISGQSRSSIEIQAHEWSSPSHFLVHLRPCRYHGPSNIHTLYSYSKYTGLCFCIKPYWNSQTSIVIIPLTFESSTYSLQIPTMAPVFNSALSTRDLSTDSTINVIFGIVAAILGILSIGVAWWAILKGTGRVEGRGPRDDSQYWASSLLVSEFWLRSFSFALWLWTSSDRGKSWKLQIGSSLRPRFLGSGNDLCLVDWVGDESRSFWHWKADWKI